MIAAVTSIAPLALGLLVVGVTGSIAQVGLSLSTERLKPKAEAGVKAAPHRRTLKPPLRLT